MQKALLGWCFALDSGEMMKCDPKVKSQRGRSERIHTVHANFLFIHGQ